MKSWLPLLLENIKDIELSENFLIKNNFFNFSLPLSNGDDFLSYTDGMHLLKRMRYEVVNRIYLFLVKYDGKKYQKVSFYLPEFQKLVSSKCGKFVFSSNGLTKMDDDYPHLIFGEDLCQFILTILLTNKDQNIKRIAFKWLIFCIIGCSLDLLVNGNKAIPEENHFSVVILGFFLMFQIERKTCNSQYLPRLFTVQVMREYLNLMVGFFREISTCDELEILVKRFGSMILEHFYAMLRRPCYSDDRLIRLAHSFEKIIALRIIKETDEMKWFEKVNRRQIQQTISCSILKWNWETASKIFTMSDNLFQILMEIDVTKNEKHFELPLNISMNLLQIFSGKSTIDSYEQQINKTNTNVIYTISHKSFHNKGSNAKSRLNIGSVGIFSSHETKNKTIEHENISHSNVESQDHIIDFQDSPINYSNSQNKHSSSYKKPQQKASNITKAQLISPVFETKNHSNLCFFNQALHLILHCDSIFEWVNKKKPTNIKSSLLCNLYFVGKDYYNCDYKKVLNIKEPYNSLVDVCFDALHINKGDQYDSTDIIELILGEFKKEKPSIKNEYSSTFNNIVKSIEYDCNGNNNTAAIESPIYYLCDQSPKINMKESEFIKIPDLKACNITDTFKTWIYYNLQSVGPSEYVPLQMCETSNLFNAIQASFYPESSTISHFKYKKDNGLNPNLIKYNEINFSLQALVSYPRYLFFKINYIGQRQGQFLINEKLAFVGKNESYAEYSVIAITFFKANHFYSLIRYKNANKGPLWALYNDPEIPSLYEGLYEDAMNYFGLNNSKPSIVLFEKY